MVYYDPYLPEVIEDPYPVYARLRREAPVYYLERFDAWVLSRFEDIWQASQDRVHYSTANSTADLPFLKRQPAAMEVLSTMDPHVGVGLVAADGGALAWPLMTSILRAKEYLFLGKRIPAQDALALGLANRIVPKGQALDESLALAHELARLPAQALQDTKRALNLHLERAFSGVLEYAISAETEAMNSADHLERVQKFLDEQS